MQIGERIFRQMKRKTQAILGVLTSIFDKYDGKDSVEIHADDSIRGHKTKKGAVKQRDLTAAQTVGKRNEKPLLFFRFFAPQQCSAFFRQSQKNRFQFDYSVAQTPLKSQSKQGRKNARKSISAFHRFRGISGRDFVAS